MNQWGRSPQKPLSEAGCSRALGSRAVAWLPALMEYVLDVFVVAGKAAGKQQQTTVKSENFVLLTAEVGEAQQLVASLQTEVKLLLDLQHSPTIETLV